MSKSETNIKVSLEELKIYDNRELKFEEWQFDVIKFYYTVIFSAVTASIGLISAKVIKDFHSLWPLAALVTFFGFVCLRCLTGLGGAGNSSRENQAILRGAVHESVPGYFSQFNVSVVLLFWVSLALTLVFAFPTLQTYKSNAFLLGAILGGVVVLGLLSSLIVVSLNQARRKAQETMRRNNVRNLDTALAQYYTDHNDRYPVLDGDLEDLWPHLSEYFSQRIEDPVKGKTYRYESTNGKSFKIYYPADNNTEEYKIYDSKNPGFD